MDFHSIFKQLQKIEPAPGYVRRSRAIILAQGETSLLRVGLTRIFKEVLQSGSVLALASVVLVVVLGGVSAWRVLKPGLAALDPAGLTAEAQAIDIQLELAGVDYTELVSPESTLADPASVVKKVLRKEGEAPAPSSTEAVSVDEALRL